MENHLDRREKSDRAIDVCDKLNSLGVIVSWMAYMKDGDELLNQVGQHFGLIICDYAKELDEIVSPASGVIGDFYEYGGVTLLDQARATKEMIESGELSGWMKNQAARDVINGVDKLLNDNLHEITTLYKYFEETLKQTDSEKEQKAA